MIFPDSSPFRPWTWVGAWIDFAVITASSLFVAGLLFSVAGSFLWTILAGSLEYNDAYAAWYGLYLLCFQILEIQLLWLFAVRRGYTTQELWSSRSHVPRIVWLAILVTVLPYTFLSAKLLNFYFPEETAADVYDWTTYVGTSAAPVFVVSACIFAPLSEELIFRRLLIESARPRSLNIVLASCASSAGWALIHVYSWPSTLAIFFEGLFLCWLAVKCKSIWPGILAHAIFNACSMWAIIAYAAEQNL
jgi:membrane protease YdiL (CAAX protease family)